MEKTVGSHYNLPGHQKAYFKVQVIERVMPNDKFCRLEREDFWMKKLNALVILPLMGQPQPHPYTHNTVDNKSALLQYGGRGATLQE